MKPAHLICHNANRWRGRVAFSLIEIMVAVALLAVIIVGLLAMFYQVQRAFRAGTAQADIMEGGRATMSLLTRDLQDMAPSNVEFVTNCVIVPSFGITPTVQDYASGNQRQNYLQDVCFLSRLNDEWTGVAYRLSNAVSGVGTLYRFVTNRFSETLPVDNSNVISNLSEYVAFRATPYNNLAYHRVLDGVVSFKITAYATNGVPYWENNPLNTPTGFDGYANVFDVNLHVAKPYFYGFRSNALPAYLEIELAVLEPTTLAKFRAREEIGPAQATGYLTRQIGRTHIFRQRVAIRPAATEVAGRF
jgi:type II secretory pathway pseudopilin PulG